MRCGVRVASSGLDAAAIPLRLVQSSPQAVFPNLAENQAERSKAPLTIAIPLAMVGGILGLVGAFQTELPGGILVPWVWAPVLEEVFKPTGLYLLLARWPNGLRSQVYIALLAALGGLSFALIESTIYMTLYFPEHTQSQLVFRFTAPVMLHVVASFIFGMGVNRELFQSLASGGPFPKRSWPFFLTAIAIHSAYNITVTILEVTDNI